MNKKVKMSSAAGVTGTLKADRSSADTIYMLETN